MKKIISYSFLLIFLVIVFLLYLSRNEILEESIPGESVDPENVYPTDDPVEKSYFIEDVAWDYSKGK